MAKYQERQRQKAERLISEENKVFNGGKGGRYFMRSNRNFVLMDYEDNFYPPIKDESIEYFQKNEISWWGGKKPTGHTLSSQIACVNHLFAIRNDKQAVLALLKSVSDDFVDVYKIETDKHTPAYIQFESVSNNDNLNEGQSNRGSNCTSIDALIFAKHKDKTKWLIPIEWKYTEHYNNTDKSIEDSYRKSPKHKKGDEAKGKERLNRYCYNEKGRLIDASNNLKSLPEYKSSIYFFEPFYQLMRQTLWAEQMINNKKEIIKADNYLHLHIIPKENEDLLHKKYKCSGSDMESTWRNHLKDNTKYKIISPELFLKNIDKEKYKGLIEYLKTRYWE